MADGGKVTDKSFNESGLAGVAQYGNDSATPYNLIEPSDHGQISAAYGTAVNKGANVFVGSGFYHASPASVYFPDHLDKTFIGIDCDFTNPTIAQDSYVANRINLASIIFPTEQAGYLAGIYSVQYIAEHKTQFTPDKVGGVDKYKAATFGGGKFLAVTS